MEAAAMSLNSQQAGRDAESYDDDRKEGRYAGRFPVEPCAVEPLHPDSQAALDRAMAQIERAFGKAAPAVRRAA